VSGCEGLEGKQVPRYASNRLKAFRGAACRPSFFMPCSQGAALAS
jgi:hypothetical protein